MDGSLRDRLGRLLQQAADLPAADRAGFLDTECAGDSALRAELESLLVAYESSVGYFEGLAERLLPAPLDAEPESGDDDTADDVAIGRTISHYEVLERVGRGGMGVVYKARDVRLGRHVALKFLPAERVADVRARERLVAEAQAASALDHPNIGVVHDIGETGAGALFIAMGWYEGETLKQRLVRGAVSVTDCITLARQLAVASQALGHHDVPAARSARLMSMSAR